MRLKHEEQGRLVFAGRTPVLPPIWVGVALVIGPACLALLAPGPLTPPRIVTAVLIGGLGAALIAYSWPREVRLIVDTREREVVARNERTPLTDAASYQLVPVPPETAGAGPGYGVAVIPRDGAAPVLIVATMDPGAALADLARLQALLRLPVRGGWGLTAAAPWVDVESSEQPPEDGALAIERAGKRRAVRAMLLGSVAIGLGIAHTVRGRMALGEGPALLSLVLPALGVLSLLALAAVLATSERRLRFDGALVSEQRLFGLTLARAVLPRDTIRAAYLVSPDAGAPRHLLLDTDGGPRAFPYDGERAASVAPLLTR